MGISVRSVWNIGPEVSLYFKKGFLVLKNKDTEAHMSLCPGIKIEKRGKNLRLEPVVEKTTSEMRSFFVRFKRLIIGFSSPTTKHLLLKGVGFKSHLDKSENEIVFKLGFSHLIRVKIPLGIQVEIKKGTRLSLTSAYYSELLNFSHYLTRLKKKDPYKGKGIIFFNKTQALKPGKKQ